MYLRKKHIFQFTVAVLLLIGAILIAVNGRKKAVVGIESTVEPYGPAGVTMTVDESTIKKRSAAVTVHNGTDSAFKGIGGVYCIEKEIDGVWYILKDDNYSINYFDWSLPAGGDLYQKFDWYDHFGVLTKGHYRIVNYLFEVVNEPGTDFCILAEFDI